VSPVRYAPQPARRITSPGAASIFASHGGYFNPLQQYSAPVPGGRAGTGVRYAGGDDRVYYDEIEKSRRWKDRAYDRRGYGSLYGDEGAGNWDYDYRPSRVNMRREKEKGIVKSIDEDLYDNKNRREEENKGLVPINNREVRRVRERVEIPGEERVVRRTVVDDPKVVRRTVVDDPKVVTRRTVVDDPGVVTRRTVTNTGDRTVPRTVTDPIDGTVTTI